MGARRVKARKALVEKKSHRGANPEPMGENESTTKITNEERQPELHDEGDAVKERNNPLSMGRSRLQPCERPEKERVHEQETSVGMMSTERGLNMRRKIPQGATRLIPRKEGEAGRKNDREDRHTSSSSQIVTPSRSRSRELNTAEHHDKRERHTTQGRVKSYHAEQTL